MRRNAGIPVNEYVMAHGDESGSDAESSQETRLDMDTPLEISTDGQNIVISPTAAGSEDEFRASLDRINAQFAGTLKRLAE